MVLRVQIQNNTKKKRARSRAEVPKAVQVHRAHGHARDEVIAKVSVAQPKEKTADVEEDGCLHEQDLAPRVELVIQLAALVEQPAHAAAVKKQK